MLSRELKLLIQRLVCISKKIIINKNRREMTMKTTPFVLIALIVVLTLSACSTAWAAPEKPAVDPAPVEPAPAVLPAAAEARKALAEKLGLTPEQIEIIEAEEVEWPDPCLGVPEPDELCAMVITPGYRVVLEAEGQSYELRTDLTGETVRMERSNPAESAIEAARQALAAKLGIDVSEIDLVLVLEEMFPNACLGLAEEDEMCAEVIVDGWIIELMAQGQTYLVHTDNDGYSLRFASSIGEAEEGGEFGDEALNAAKEALASQTGAPVQSISLVDMNRVDWRDGCLEVHEEDGFCTMVIVFGYSIILEAEGQQYEVRTNLDGHQVVIAGEIGS
jgi:hypothetical protein